MTAKWIYDDTRIWIQLRGRTLGWLGLILKPSGGGMSRGDTHCCFVDSNGAHCMDQWSSSTVVPTADTLRQDLEEVIGYESGGFTQVSYSRLLTNNDPQDFQFTVASASSASSSSWSIGRSDAYIQHLDGDFGKYSVAWLGAQSTVPASAPGLPVLTAATLNSITIRWTTPYYRGSSPMVNYSISVETAPGSGVYTTALNVTAKTYTATISGLQTFSLYGVKINAVAANSVGAFSPVVFFRTLNATQFPPLQPASPTRLAGSATSLTVKWTAPQLNGTDIYGYLIQASLSPASNIWNNSLTTTDATSVTSVVSGLTSNTTYGIRVIALSVAGNSPPSNYTLMKTNSLADCLNQCSGHGVCYRAQCQCNAGFLGMDCSKVADFQKCASNGASQWCIYWTYDSSYIYAQMTAQTLGWIGMIIGNDPTNGMGNGDSWMFSVTKSASGDYVTAASDMFSTSISTPSTDTKQDLLDVVGYETTTSTFVNFKRLLNTGDSADKSIVSGLMECSWAYYTADGFGQHTTSQRGRFQIEFLQPLAKTPSQPLNVTQTAATTSSISLMWNPPQYQGGGPINMYVGLANSVQIWNGTVLTATLTGLTTGTSYSIEVAASNVAYGLGPTSTRVSMSTLNANQLPPDAPTAIQLVKAEATAITFSWTASTLHGLPVTNYLIESSLSTLNQWTSAGSIASPTTTYKVTGLNAETVYDFRVKADSLAGSSAPSSVFTQNTTAFAACTNNCNGHGSCVRGECQCQVGWLGTDCGKQGIFSQCFNPSNTLCLSWIYNQTDIFFQLTSALPSSQWVSIIVDHDITGGMNNGDNFVFLPGTNAQGLPIFRVEDRFSANILTPTLDASQDLQDVSSYLNSNSVMVTNFRRKIVTNDAKDKPIVAGAMRVSWAVGVGASFVEHLHTPDAQGKTTVEFLKPFVSGPPSPPLVTAPTLVAASNTTLTLNFFPSASNGSSWVTSYQIYAGIRSNAQLFWSNATTRANATTYILSNSLLVQDKLAFNYNVTGLTATTCYPFFIRAQNADGYSNFSQLIACTLSSNATCPPALDITSVVLSNGGGTHCDTTSVTKLADPTMLSLMLPPYTGDPAVPFVGYRVEMVIDNGGTIPLAHNNNQNNNILNKLKALPTPVAKSASSPSTSSFQLQGVGTATSCTTTRWTIVYFGVDRAVNITNLQPNTKYNIRVTLVNVVGSSTPSQPSAVQSAAAGQCPGGGNCNGHGTCMQLGVCSCDKGYVGMACEVSGATSQVLSSSPYFEINFKVDQTAKIGYFSILAETDGWSGLILQAPDGMSNGDTWFFYPTPSALLPSINTIEWWDRWSTGLVNPSAGRDVSDDLKDVSGYMEKDQGISTNRMYVTFNRKLSTGDVGDVDLVDAMMDVAWSMGPSSASGDTYQHGTNQRGRVKLNFFTGALTTLPEIKLTYFLPVGISLAVVCVTALFFRVLPFHLPHSILHMNWRVLFGLHGSIFKPYTLNWLDTLTLDLRVAIMDVSLGEIGLVLGYLIGLLVTIAQAKTQFDNAQRKTVYFWGDLTAFHMALSLLPIARNSLWLYVLGVSYDRAIRWHRWVSRLCVALCIAHFVTILPLYELDDLLATKKTPSGGGNLYGFISMIAMLAMTLTSIEFIRRRFFEVFYYLHYLFILAVLFACLHSHTCFKLCIGPICLYGLDRLIRLYRSQVLSTEIVKSEVVILDRQKKQGVVALTLKRSGLNRAKGGEYVFLQANQISYFQWHPFSISSLPTETTPNTITLHISCVVDSSLDDMSQSPSSFCSALLRLVHHQQLKSVKVDGSHGHIDLKLFQHYHTIVLVAGGIGVTPMLSVMQELCHYFELHPHQTRALTLSKVHLIWSASSVEMFSKVIPPQLQQLFIKHKDKVHIHYYCSSYKGGKAAGASTGVVVAAAGKQVPPATDEHELTDNPLLELASPSTAAMQSAEKEVELITLNISPPATTNTPPKPPSPPQQQGWVSNLEQGIHINSSRPDYFALLSGFLQEGDHGKGMSSRHLCVLTCGPALMMSSVQMAAEKHKADFHKETFFF